MKFGHPARRCYHKVNLVCKICHSNHHTYLHNENIEESTDESPTQSNAAVTMSTNTSVNPSSKVIFQTAKAVLLNDKHQSIKVNVLFDPGSDRSYVRKQSCERLNLKCHENCV